MKDLLGKIATIEYPGLLAGPTECRGFDYNAAGTLVRWQGQTQFVPIGGLSVRGVKDEPGAAKPVSQKVSESELKLLKANEELTARLNAAEAQMRQAHTERTQQQAQQVDATLKRIAELEAKLAEAAKGGKGEGEKASDVKAPVTTSGNPSPESQKSQEPKK